jgi:hypothetical protein
MQRADFLFHSFPGGLIFDFNQRGMQLLDTAGDFTLFVYRLLVIAHGLSDLAQVAYRSGGMAKRTELVCDTIICGYIAYKPLVAFFIDTFQEAGVIFRSPPSSL